MLKIQMFANLNKFGIYTYVFLHEESIHAIVFGL